MTLVGEVLDDVKIDGVVVGLNAEDLLLERHFLAGLGAVNFQNF